MHAAFDRFGDIFDYYRFCGIVADAAGSAQKDHRRWNFFCDDHGIVSCAADHAVWRATGFADCLFYLGRERRIHGHCRLIEALGPTDFEAAAIRNLFGLVNETVDRALANRIIAMANVEREARFCGDNICGPRFGFD